MCPDVVEANIAAKFWQICSLSASVQVPETPRNAQVLVPVGTILSRFVRPVHAREVLKSKKSFERKRKLSAVARGVSQICWF